MPLTGEKKRKYARLLKRRLRAEMSDRERLANKINVSLDHCSHCGWYGACDMHHISGKQNGASNLLVLCPNCHRDIHTCGLRGSNDGVEGV